ncbi:hypothetical protein [Enterococcus faecalis]|uniref:hypothetical protein n=1 Tax=Enterococcus faecalis TaxID=1351 RepID=UPI004041F2AC
MEILVLIGMLGVIVSVILFIILLFKKLPKKKAFLLFIISFILMIVGASNMNKEVSDNKTQPSVTETNKSQKKNQEKLNKELANYKNEDYPYILSAEIDTKPNDDINYVQLNLSSDWLNLNTDEKQNYIGVLKAIAAPFTHDNKLPFMQIKAGEEIVARSEISDANKIKILK